MTNTRQTNIQLVSNLMLDDKEHQPNHKYYPGDFVALIYPHYTDSRVMHFYLTKEQMIELEQVYVCFKCKKPCAGTC
jgi:hypothetical protein